MAKSTDTIHRIVPLPEPLREAMQLARDTRGLTNAEPGPAHATELPQRGRSGAGRASRLLSHDRELFQIDEIGKAPAGSVGQSQSRYRRSRRASSRAAASLMTCSRYE